MSLAFDFDRHGHLQPLQPAADVLAWRAPAPRRARRPSPADIRLDPARDALLTPFGKATLQDRYLLAGETCQGMFARVACAYADDVAHAQRLYDAMSRLWFMPSTPILSNGGTDRGLPISCFLNSVSDSLDSIVETWNENVALASNGGGIGTYWGR
ncbi:MAG TPA: ribonucleotide reductase N-terminal alpha domain-containing protein, partial [Beijerinckiaceae bacterium]